MTAGPHTRPEGPLDPLRHSDVPIACIHSDTATELAERIMALRRVDGTEQYWASLACRILRLWLMAAAITGTEFGRLREQIHEAGVRAALTALRSRPDVVPERDIRELETMLTCGDLSRNAVLAEITLALEAAIRPDLPGTAAGDGPPRRTTRD